MINKIYNAEDALAGIAPAGGTVVGVPLVEGVSVRIPYETVATGEAYAYDLIGTYDLVKATGSTAFAIGATVYWDADTSKCVADSAELPIGTAKVAATAGDTTVRVSVFPCAGTDAELTTKIDKVTGATGNFGTFNASGNLVDAGVNSASYSASGHTHANAASGASGFMLPGTATGDVAYWNGSAWALLAACPTAGFVLKSQGTAAAPTWATAA